MNIIRYTYAPIGLGSFSVLEDSSEYLSMVEYTVQNLLFGQILYASSGIPI